MKSYTIPLNHQEFAGIRGEKTLVESEELRVSIFNFDSGVEGLSLQNKKGEVTALPFLGQQIWSAKFLGRELTMESVCKMPRYGVPFLENFGGFLQHCGMLAMGAPGPNDNHPLHGEFPVARMDSAKITIGEDTGGDYVTLESSYQHGAVFGSSYLARPYIKLRSNSSIFECGINVRNLSKMDMEYMYMAHINFRSVEGSEVIYSAQPHPGTIRVRASIPSHITPKEGYREFLDELSKNPSLHHKITKDLPADPEIVLSMDYLADSKGWAHSLQLLPDGTADYVSHRVDQLPKATRWISRTPDQNSLALVEPGTAEPEGRSREREKGNIKRLKSGETFTCNIIAGAIEEEKASEVRQTINSILSSHR